MKKLVLMIFPALICGVIFTGCGSKMSESDTDNPKLAGSIWEAKRNEVRYVLRFIDDVNCNIGTARMDDSYSANLTSYTWMYKSDIDSRWGLFHVYNSNGKYAFSGTVENKKLFLGIVDCSDFDDSGLWFQRINEDDKLPEPPTGGFSE